MKTTLSDLRVLLTQALTHTANPAILRLTEQTVEGVARSHLAHTVEVQNSDGPWSLVAGVKHAGAHSQVVLALDDPGTANALLVALALALGLDPGVGGLDVRWKRLRTSWMIQCGDHCFRFGDRTPPMSIDGKTRCRDVADREILHAPLVATESEPVKALGLAVQHVLKAPHV